MLKLDPRLLKYLLTSYPFLFFSSCHTTKLLTENDKQWIPYQKNELLILESSLKTIDTIICLKNDTLIGDQSIYNPLSIKFEEITVFAKRSDDKLQGIELFQINKSANGKARIFPGHFDKDSWFYILDGFSVDSLANIKPQKVKVFDNTFDDVYMLYPQDFLYRKDEKNFVTKVYWSKTKGVVKYVRSDGVYWGLKYIKMN